MNYREACHHLRILPALLKWYGSYAPKGDGRTLNATAGHFQLQDLETFDSHLKTAWSSRHVPSGIERELLVEASGRCGLCDQPCETLQTAHIMRKGIETTFYFQHPTNLILLCGTCHARYDAQGLKALTLDVVRAAKDRNVARKMEAIDRDVRIADAVRRAVEDAKSELRKEVLALFPAAPGNALLWTTGATSLLSAAAGELRLETGATLPAWDPSFPADALQLLSGSLGPTQQVTHAVLDGYAQEATGKVADAPSDWEMIDEVPEPYECKMCGGLNDTVEYACEDCGHWATNTDPPESVHENQAGVAVPLYTDARGDSYELVCENCGGGNLVLDYTESFCSGCAHMLSKDD